ncbi:hypothetical protein RUND412_006462 [Rhizina undulata]
MASDPNINDARLDIAEQYGDLFKRLKPLLKDPLAAPLVEGLLEWNCMLQCSMTLAKADVKALWGKVHPFLGMAASLQDTPYLNLVDKTAAKIKKLKDELDEPSSVEQQTEMKLPKLGEKIPANVKKPRDELQEPLSAERQAEMRSRSLGLPPASRTGYEFLHLNRIKAPINEAPHYYNINLFPLHPNQASQMMAQGTNMFSLEKHETDVIAKILLERNSKNTGNGSWAVMSVDKTEDANPELKIVLGKVPGAENGITEASAVTPNNSPSIIHGTRQYISTRPQLAPVVLEQQPKPPLQIFTPSSRSHPDAYGTRDSSQCSSPSELVFTPPFSPTEYLPAQFSPQTPRPSFPTPRIATVDYYEAFPAGLDINSTDEQFRQYRQSNIWDRMQKLADSFPLPPQQEIKTQISSIISKDESPGTEKPNAPKKKPKFGLRPKKKAELDSLGIFCESDPDSN